MHAKLIKVGNSQGVRLPKAVIDQLGLEKDLELELVDGAVVIRPMRTPRTGWAEAAEACHLADDDAMHDWDAATSDFDGEWS